MAQLESTKDELEKLGAGLAYIAAERRSGLWKPGKYLRAHPVSFPFLLDEDRSVTKAYGVYHAFARDALRIAHPATIVVDRRGIIQYIYRGTNQIDRAPIDDVLSTLRKSSAR